jgi:hypothetical protein
LHASSEPFRPAGKPGCDPGAGAAATDSPRRCRRPIGPAGRRRENDIEPAAAAHGRADVEARCNAMQTMTKVREKIERVSALKGWRMRWYMQ